MKCVFRGMGCLGIIVLLGISIFVIAPILPQGEISKDAYVASVSPLLIDLENQAMSASTLIIYPTFDDAWASDVDDVYATMRTIQTRLKRVKPSLDWGATHNDLLDVSSNCVTSIEMLKIGSQAESLMDLCLTGIKRVKAKISD